MAVPLIATCAETSAPDAADRLAVTEVVAEFSAALLVAAFQVKTGGESSLLIVPLAKEGEPTEYPPPGCRVRVTVSANSNKPSAVGSICTPAVLDPAAKVTEPVADAKVTAPVCE